MTDFIFIDDQKNLKIQAFGFNRQELLSNSALALMTFVYPRQIEISEYEIKKKIRIKTKDFKSLLTDWLEELIEISRHQNLCLNYYYFKTASTTEIEAIGYGRRVKAAIEVRNLIKPIKLVQTAEAFGIIANFKI
ncbi:MAG: archease [Patescibacteria group bacterium]|jgi:SHS2 domain-containing protein|nr:archease [Patescibacteria group bacterium]